MERHGPHHDAWLAGPKAASALSEHVEKVAQAFPDGSAWRLAVENLSTYLENPPVDHWRWVGTVRGLHAVRSLCTDGKGAAGTRAARVALTSAEARRLRIEIAAVGGGAPSAELAAGTAPSLSGLAATFTGVSAAVGGVEGLGLVIAGARSWWGKRKGDAASGSNEPAGPSASPAAAPALPNEHRARSRAESLALLAVEHVSADARKFHLGGLARRGFRGNERSCFTEWILKDGPRPILESIPVETRQEIALKRAGCPEERSFDTAAIDDAILAWLGYPSLDPPHGLDAYRKQIAHFRNTMTAPGASLVGAVVPAGNAIEALLKELISFHTQNFLGEDVNEVLRNEGILEGSKDLAGETLTRLGIAAAKVGSRLPAESSWSDLFGNRRLVPKPIDQLGKCRNVFGHDNPNQTREKADEFFAHAASLLDHLQEGLPPLFPMVVVVEQRVEDLNGVRYEGRNDEGKQETIHTDETLKVGQRYHVLAKSNPFRLRK
ncbi:MAG: hypothetical protein WCJ30_15380 [Deltaproteobacteria bacterium]